MLCQSCNKNKATTHIKTINNGELKEYMLCNECAEKLGYSNAMDFLQFSLGNFLGSVLGNGSKRQETIQDRNIIRCKQCGSSFEEISNRGKFGCAECYDTFKNELIPFVERIHGNTTHVGKIPSSAGENVKLKNNIKNLKRQLKEAVSKQEFERAAEIRDAIKKIEEKVQENER